MTGFKSKKAAALDEDGMYLVHQTASAPFSLSEPSLEPPSITFNSGNAEWVMRITADRRIEVNEGVEVSEAAQKVLDALQNLLRPAAQPAQRKPLTFNEITAIEEKVYMQTTHKGKPAFEYAHALIRAVEAAHDIKEKNT